MIVRVQGDQFVLFKQHDHSRGSGVFAAYWQERPEPYESVHYAIENHDIGWNQLDHTILWNEETNRPFSFIDYPLAAKLPAYTSGIDLIERKGAYAGYLCSRHFVSFFRDSEDDESIRFVKNERKRQRRLKQSFTPHEKNKLADNYRLLKMCDDLSLFICLNEPGENTFPWFREGFNWNGNTITPIWKDRSTLTFSPYPFIQSFEIALPYQLVNRKRQVVQRTCLTIQITR